MHSNPPPPPNTTQILEKYWSEHPAWFGRSFGEYLHLGANQEMLRLILQGIDVDRSTRVLDLGCALGGNARWLASLYGSTVTGIDSFKPAIQAARQLAKAQNVSELCKFVISETNELALPDRSFDLALTAEDDVNLAEVARVVRSGGDLVGSQVAIDGAASLERRLTEVGFEIDQLVDVTAYARAFYRAKEEEAKLLVQHGLMSPNDMLSLQMHTVDLYEAGGASHALFRAHRR